MSENIYVVMCEWFTAPSLILGIFTDRERADRLAADNSQTAGADVYVLEEELEREPL